MPNAPSLAGQRIAVVYDCLFPYTVGGGERWYRLLAEGLRDAGADVTYLTRRQWNDPPRIAGIQVRAVSGRSELYDADGKRKLMPTLRFGAGLFWWLVRHRRAFDTLQVAHFPFWSVIAVRAALAGSGVRVIVDWFEVWSAAFWRSYAGVAMGTVGHLIQRLCLMLSPRIIVLSASNAQRLLASGRRHRPIVLAGLLPSGLGSKGSPGFPVPGEPPFVLFAGRHIRDKGVDLLPEVFDRAARAMPELRFVIAGDGPMRKRVTDECRERGIAAVVDIAGFVADQELERLIAHASCVVVPSRREGYGFMPVDAMGKGTPVVTAGFAENLAVDNIESGRNGFVAAPPTPDRLAEAIVDVVGAGQPLRESTFGWYEEHAATKTVDCSVRQMVRAHADWAERRRQTHVVGPDSRSKTGGVHRP
jgi:glycosyltransferase involved in cell wall biosynthesis